MTKKTLDKILLAIAWLSLRNLPVNKKSVSNYSNLDWKTVSLYFEDVLPSMFLIKDAENFNDCYVRKPIQKGVKVCKQKEYLHI